MVTKRADARRNEQTLLAAATRVFVTSGIAAPVRDIASEAGVGVATIYRHFPTRADLVVAVYQHQVDATAGAAAELLATSVTPYDALVAWIDLFVDFVDTKHGLADALSNDDAQYAVLHALIGERLLPACDLLLEAATEAGQLRPGLDSYELLYGIGALCTGKDERYDARKLVALLVAGLRA